MSSAAPIRVRAGAAAAALALAALLASCGDLSPMEIDIKVDGKAVASGAAVSFGEVTVDGAGNEQASVDIVIKSNGTAPLTIESIDLLGYGAEDFSLVQTDGEIDLDPDSFAGYIPGQRQATFTLSFDPLTFFGKTVTLSIPNNDVDEGNWAITLTGNVSQGPAGQSVFVAASANGGSDSNAGTTPAAPMLTIAAAMAKAADQGYGLVRVSVGTYDETITMQHGVSLYGGYDAGFTTRDIDAYATIVEPSSGSCIVDATAGTLTNEDFVDGFYLQSTNGPTIGINMQGAAGSPLICNNRIIMSRTAADTTTIFAVDVYNTSTQNLWIRDNKIRMFRSNMPSSASNHAIRAILVRSLSNASTITIERNDIAVYGGGGNVRAFDLQVLTAGTVVIRNNCIVAAGDANANTVHAIYTVNQLSAVQVIGNTILARTASLSNCYAVRGTSGGTAEIPGSMTLVDNVVGTPSGSCAIYTGDTAFTLSGNLFYGFTTTVYGGDTTLVTATNQVEVDDLEAYLFVSPVDWAGFDAAGDYSHDLHLADDGTYAVDKGVTWSGFADDIDGQARPNGTKPDRGADEVY